MYMSHGGPIWELLFKDCPKNELETQFSKQTNLFNPSLEAQVAVSTLIRLPHVTFHIRFSKLKNAFFKPGPINDKIKALTLQWILGGSWESLVCPGGRRFSQPSARTLGLQNQAENKIKILWGDWAENLIFSLQWKFLLIQDFNIYSTWNQNSTTNVFFGDTYMPQWITSDGKICIFLPGYPPSMQTDLETHF